MHTLPTRPKGRAVSSILSNPSQQIASINASGLRLREEREKLLPRLLVLGAAGGPKGRRVDRVSPASRIVYDIALAMGPTIIQKFSSVAFTTIKGLLDDFMKSGATEVFRKRVRHVINASSGKEADRLQSILGGSSESGAEGSAVFQQVIDVALQDSMQYWEAALNVWTTYLHFRGRVKANGGGFGGFSQQVLYKRSRC